MIRFHDAFGIKQTFEIFARAGIEGIDFNLDTVQYRTGDYDREFYVDLGNYARECGITVCQAHAPFPSSFPEEEKTAKRFEEIVKSIENASYLGAPMIVVHPCCHLDHSVEGNFEKMFEYNLDFYKRLIPYAEKYGVKIAIENLDCDSVTSKPEGLNRLYDTLKDPVFTVCFDVGHCLLHSVDPAEAIRAIGERLVVGCTHVHDNFGESDSHALPYYGGVEWESVMKALADIGYKGDLNYEAAGFLRGLPTELRPDGLAYMAKIGPYLIGRFEHYQNTETK